MKTITIFNHYLVNATPLNDFINEETGLINTLNAYSFVLAQGNPKFKEALVQSDILLPDGFPVVLANRWLTGKKIQKIAGEDIS